MAIGQARATLDDLMRTEGKAELIGGRIVRNMPTGHDAGLIATTIVANLFVFARQAGQGKAFSDGVGYSVAELPSGRETFCPDVSYYSGPRPARPRKFIEGPPDFAVEVRSDGDYGKRAEAQIAAKRADYFAAGTLVVWDVDPEAEEIRSYRSDSPENPAVYRRGDLADAEPAVPGWRIPVDEVFAL